VLIGEHTKNLYRFVRWEIETAQDLDLPIIAVNLNKKRRYDVSLCPAIMRDKYIVHVAFRARIIKHAMDRFPSQYRRRSLDEGGNLTYSDDVYTSVGIDGLSGDLASRRGRVFMPWKLRIDPKGPLAVPKPPRAPSPPVPRGRLVLLSLLNTEAAGTTGLQICMERLARLSYLICFPSPSNTL